ncbi:MAG: class I SAM-dependent methyltransferase [Lactococcus plantarum]|nr:class I SAM-dependent methyltransferase [Lactococcus plantarum]MDN6085048.1 class I SAM-dependent methyltransferase [Lactococcus plantarum]
MKLFDLGCGADTFTDEISKTYPNIMVTDGSKDLISKAKAAYPTSNFEVVDALNMIDDSQCDIVVSKGYTYTSQFNFPN